MREKLLIFHHNWTMKTQSSVARKMPTAKRDFSVPLKERISTSSSLNQNCFGWSFLAIHTKHRPRGQLIIINEYFKT